MGADFWILLAVGVLLVFVILPTLLLSYIIYAVLLIRNKKEKWGRECSMPEDPEYFGMYRTGMAWREKYAAVRREVSVTSGRFRLAGEYFDFGSDRAVLIIPGRMESCLYSCFYAEPYRAAGWNVLVIDNRAHGLSDGKVSCLGYREYRDIHRWTELLTRELGNRRVLLHGICIGASTALFAAAAKDAPAELCGLVVEGMYKNFYESYKNHLIVQQRPKFPPAMAVMLWIRLVSHGNVVTDGPYRRITRLRLPILMLHSRVDEFSDPRLAAEMYESCTAPKKMVWFDVGAHSRVRVNNPEQYDAAVTAFAGELLAEAAVR